MAISLDQFMAALSGQESGGNYQAENGRTKAYGRFQIMPGNWPSWSKEAGIAGASPTPENQDKVAAFKLQQYYDKFGNWEDVASAWYSGSPLSAYNEQQRTRKQGNGDEPSIQSYVDSIMGKLGESGGYSGAGAGSAGGSQMSSGGRYYKDSALDGQYTGLRDALLKAQQAWIKAGRPNQGAQFDSYQESLFDFQDFSESFGHPNASSNDTDPAQTDFDNRIKLGDLEGRNADRLFNQWFNKYTTAMASTSNEVTQRANHNAAQLDLVEARNTSQTPGSLPRPTDRGYVEEPYGDIASRWLQKMGVGDAPDPSMGGGSGIGLPTQGTANSEQPNAGVDSFSLDFPSLVGQPTAPRSAPFDAGSAVNLAPGVRGQQGQKVVFTDDWRLGSGGDSGNASSDVLSRGRQTPQQDLGGGGGYDFGLPGRNDALAIPKTAVAVSRAGSAAGKAVAKGAKKWWQRQFAAGGQNIPGGPGWVGEKGPEIMEVPGFGAKWIGQGGPEQINIPEGSNIIPQDEAFAYHQIKQAAAQGNAPDQQRQSMSAQERMNDPQLREKVMASLSKGMASNMVENPPYTPVLENPALQKDRWAANRQISGVPATVEEQMLMQEAAAKKGKK